ncbi:transposase [Alicyclobacillaceae bacterium I2511]|nr:transposase [Alicyclobacillaceae bacterium I2511]
MSMRKHYTAAFKAQVVQEILKEDRTIAQISAEFGVHPTMLHKWKNTVIENMTDPHVNVILRDALRYRWASGQPPVLIVCDKRQKASMDSLIRNIWGIPSLGDAPLVDAAWRKIFLGLTYVGWMWTDGLETFPMDTVLERLCSIR